jgi:hypothetical protein
MGAEAEAALSAHFEAMLGEQRRVLSVIAKNSAPPEAPAFVTFYGSAVSDASANNLVIVPHPQIPHGYLWHVRFLMFSGPSTFAAVGGTGNVYVGPHPATSAQGDRPEGWRDSATLTLPQPAFYGHGELVVKAPDRIYAMVQSPTASTTYVFGGTAEQVPDTAHAPELTAL